MASNDNVNKALLPAGLRDLLPPEADLAADVVERLRQGFARHGYRAVKPPLIEFEQSLLEGAGTALMADTFRLMDPVSQRMMGVRSDLTVQIARIATTRLKKSPRPLRLTYAGDVLRVKGTQLRPERQFSQVGAELIGAPDAAADVEAILLGVEALRGLGMDGLTVDLTVPRLVPKLCAAHGVDGVAATRIRSALDRKDAAAVKSAGTRAGLPEAVLTALLFAAGDAGPALEAIAELDLPDEARSEADRLAEVVTEIMTVEPELRLTVDPVEHRGFEYHTGISFTFFKAGVRGELGSGGRYEATPVNGSTDAEPATGFTLYLDTVLRALPARKSDRRLFLPWGVSRSDGTRYRDDGWSTVAALQAHGDGKDAAVAEARRQLCSHVLIEGEVTPVSTKQRQG